MVSAEAARAADFEPRQATQWYPFVEWAIADVTVNDGASPFDAVAWVRFEHADSGEVIRTGMFYDGEDTWKFRFAGTKVGRWTFTTASDDAAALNGLRGAVEVTANADPVLGRGFITANRHQWTWSGSGKPFVPQLVLASHPGVYFENPRRIADDVQLWYGDHGFNGMHVGVMMRWFDIQQDQPTREDKDDPNPDIRTFQTLERLIAASYEAGGMIHLWQWADQQRHKTPIGLKGGINGDADRRLQRYIAARLGPLPGWTMGYGFDLWEWVDGDQLVAWHRFLHDQFGWPHVLGARAHRHGTPLAELLTDQLDYAGYETHQPDIEIYAAAIAMRPDKPAFMEDRFRVRDPSPYPDKDYTADMVRRGLWRSMMAGGVANIWGYHPQPTGESQPFPNRDAIKTYAAFHDRYFQLDMLRDGERTNGHCLRTHDKSVLMFYWEDEQFLRMDLSDTPGPLRAIAVNARQPYEQIDLGEVSGKFEWHAPQVSDWAVAVTRR